MALFEVFRNASDSFLHDVNENLFHMDVADELLKHHFIKKCTADLLKDFDVEDGAKTRVLVSELAHVPSDTTDDEAAVNKLYSCLQRTGYSHLVTICKRYTDEFDRMHELFSAGRIPSPPAALVNRPELITRIRKAIASSCTSSSSQKQNSWVIIRGMAGTGKSVALSVAVRDPAFAVKYFHRGVFWLSFNRMQSGLVDVELDKRLILLYRCVSSTINPGGAEASNEPHDRDEIINRLRGMFLKHKFVRDSILILDDVWDEKVFKIFAQLECKCTIVTTRLRHFRSIPVDNMITIDIDDGFTAEQSLQLFTTVLCCSSSSQLPPEAMEIYGECCGSPIAISLIASILKERPDWKGVLDELRQSQLTRLCRRRSGGAAETVDADSSNLLLTKAISMSVDNLSSEDREKFLHFAAFNDDVPVPADALCIIWSLPSRDDVCRQMHAYVNSSLCNEEFSTKIGQSVYWLHDLILDYLKDLARQQSSDNDDLLTQYHRDIVEAYRKKCSGDWYNLPYDFYAHRFLYWHMLEAEMYSDVTNLYTNLVFLSRKVQRNGVESILLDYSLIYKKMRLNSNGSRRRRRSSGAPSSLNKAELEKLQAFERFFLNNKTFIHCSGSNLLQIGLLQPRSSLVYASALKSYEAWHANQHDLPEIYLFSWLNQPHALQNSSPSATDSDVTICAARIYLSHPIQCGAFLRRDKHSFVLADNRGVLQHYDIRSLKRVTEKLQISNGAAITAIAVLKTGDKILVASDDGYVRLTRLAVNMPSLSRKNLSNVQQQHQQLLLRAQSSSSQQKQRMRHIVSGPCLDHGGDADTCQEEYKLKRAHCLSVSDSEGDSSDDDASSIAESNCGSVISYNNRNIPEAPGSSDGETPAAPPMQYDGHIKNYAADDKVGITAMTIGISGKRCLSGDSRGGLHYWNVDDQKMLCSAEIHGSKKTKCEEEILSLALGATEEWAVSGSVASHSKLASVRLWHVTSSALAECWKSSAPENEFHSGPCVVACRTPQFKNIFLVTSTNKHCCCVEQFRVDRKDANLQLSQNSHEKQHFSVHVERKFMLAAIDDDNANNAEHRCLGIGAVCLTHEDLYLAVAAGHLIFIYDFAASMATTTSGSQQAENVQIHDKILCILRGPVDQITSLSAAHVQQQLLVTCRNGSAFAFNVANGVQLQFDTPVRRAAHVDSRMLQLQNGAVKKNDMNEFVVRSGARASGGGGVIYDSSSYDVCFIHHREMSDNTIIDNNDAATMPTGILVLTSDCVRQNPRYVALTLYRFDDDAENSLTVNSFNNVQDPPCVRNKLQIFLRLPFAVDVMKICPDARLLIFGMQDGTLRFVRLNRKVIMQENIESEDIVEKFCDLKHHEGRICTIQFHYGYAVTTGEDFSVRFWALNGVSMLNSNLCGGTGGTACNWPPVHVMCFVAHSSPVVNLVLPQPSHSLVYVAHHAASTVTGKLSNFDVEQRFKIMAVQHQHNKPAFAAAAPVSADKFVSIGNDGLIKLCSLHTAHSLLAGGSLTSSSPATRTPSDHAWCMSNDGKYLLGCSSDGRAQIWDIEAALMVENQPPPSLAAGDAKRISGGGGTATLINQHGGGSSPLMDETPVAVCQAFSSATTCGIFLPVTRTRLNIVGDGYSTVSNGSSAGGSDDVDEEFATEINAVRRSSLPTLAVDANASPDFFSSLVVLGSQDGELVFWNWQRSEVPLYRHRVSSSAVGGGNGSIRAPILQIAHFAIYERNSSGANSNAQIGIENLMPINLVVVLSDALYVYKVPDWIANATDSAASGDHHLRRKTRHVSEMDNSLGEEGAEREHMLPLQVFPLLGRGARKFFLQSARKMIVVADDIGYLYVLKPEF